MTILLTGSKGFLGGWIAKELDARKIDWRPLNVRLDEVGQADFKGISTVIHCAAKIPVGDVSDESYRVTNVVGTGQLLEQCRLHHVSRFIYLSSMGVSLPSPYTRSKLEPEDSVKQSGLQWLIIRPAHLYGPNEHSRLTFEMLRAKRLQFVVGLGRNPVFLSYVRDCAAAVVDAALSSLTGQTFNVTEPEISEVKYLRTVRKAIGARFVIIPVPRFVAEMRLGKEKVAQMITNLRIPGVADWNFVPTRLETGLRDTHASFGEQQP